MNSSNLTYVEFLVRTIAGFLFLFQGYDKLFRVHINAVVDTIMNDVYKYKIPRSFIYLAVSLSSSAEFVGGIFLLLGFFVNATLTVLGLDLLFVCLAFSFIEPMWDTKHVFPRLILVLVLLLLPQPKIIWGLDFFLKY